MEQGTRFWKGSMMRSAALLSGAVAAVLPAAGQAQTVSGLYVGAGAGANWLQDQPVALSVTPPFTVAPSVTRSYDVGVVGVGSVGYGFGNGLRLEVEGSYRNNRKEKAVSTPGSTVLSDGGREDRYGAMVNVLYDIPVSFVVQPYAGLGLGYQWSRQHIQNGTLAANTVILNETGGTQGSFAYQAIVGATFQIAAVPGLAVTAEYRFMGLSNDRTYGSANLIPGTAVRGRNTQRINEDYNHFLMLGVRYAFNQAPAPVMGKPPPPAAVRESARTYLVFFDWDPADLIDRARQIIAEAAQATTRVQVTRIEVSGHTDKSGTPRYNQGLSVRRAQNVAAELVRLGVPRGAITTQGFGESRPLVPTADGVREPQNRRLR